MKLLRMIIKAADIQVGLRDDVCDRDIGDVRSSKNLKLLCKVTNPSRTLVELIRGAHLGRTLYFQASPIL